MPYVNYEPQLLHLTVECCYMFNNLQLSPPVDPNDAKAKQTQAILKYLPLMIGWFSLQVPAALGVYWMTNNIITTTATQTIKGYLKANPPQLDIPEVHSLIAANDKS
jgi:YidC/Oxa1 family membrane protein insertase